MLKHLLKDYKLNLLKIFDLIVINLTIRCYFDKTILIRKAKKLEITCDQGKFAAELDGDAVTSAPLTIELDEEPIKFIA